MLIEWLEVIGVAFGFPLIIYLISGALVKKTVSSAFTAGLSMRPEAEHYPTDLLPYAIFFLLLESTFFVILLSRSLALSLIFMGFLIASMVVVLR